MIDIDLYNKIVCVDCQKTYLISGSTAVNLIECPYCKSKNWENYKQYLIAFPNFKEK